MSGFCVQRMASIDVNRSFPIAAVEVAFGAAALVKPPRSAAFTPLAAPPCAARRTRGRFGAASQPFDSELGIEAAGFRQGGLRLIHIAFQREGGGESSGKNRKNTKPASIALLAFVDRHVEMAETEFCVGHANCNIVLFSDRADLAALLVPHRPRLFETAAGTVSALPRIP